MRDGWEARTALLGLGMGVLLGTAIGVLGDEASARSGAPEIEVLGTVQTRDAPVRVITEVCGGRRWGSGVVVDDGTVLTNRHVVDGGSDVTVWIGESEVSPVEVRVSAGLDVARLVLPAGSMDGATEAEAGAMNPGEDVAVSGAYGRIGASVVGPRTGISPADPPVAWQLDVAAPAGMSGSGVIDADGRLVGVVYAAAHGDGSALVIPAVDALAAPTTPVEPSLC